MSPQPADSSTPDVADSFVAERPRGAVRREMLSTVYYDRWRIGAVFLLGLALTLLAVQMAPNKYVAEASLLLRLGREYVYTPEVGDPGVSGAPVAYDREQTIAAETRIVTSRDLIDSVVKKVGVQNIYPKIAASGNDPAALQGAATLNLERALQAEMLKGSNLMQVSFEHPDAATAGKVLARVIDEYLQRRSVIFTSPSFGTAEADFNARRAELSAAESNLAKAKSVRKIRAFDQEQSLLLSQRNSLEMREADIALAQAQAGGRTGSLRDSLKSVAGEVTLSNEARGSESVEAARKLLLDLKLKERDLSSKYVDSNPWVEDVRSDIARTTEFIRQQEALPVRTVRTGRSPSRDVLESDLLRTLADRQQASSGAAVVARQRAAVESRLAEFAVSEQQLPALERARRLAEANYEAAAKRLRDETALAELDRKRRSSVSIVQSPMTPLASKSYRSVILLVGCFLSLGAALLTAFLSALWRDTFLTAEAVERGLDLPLLATVPRGAT